MKVLHGCKYAPLVSFNDPLSMIGAIFWQWAEPDRFDILNESSPYNFKPIKKPLPQKISPKESMEDLIIIKANELVKKYSDKEIVVFWSGGVDSTCVICALISAGISRNQLVVVYTKESIAENLTFYNWLIKNKYRMIKFPWKMIERVFSMFPSSVFINGWCADQLFGSNVNLVYPELYDVDFRSGLKQMIKDDRFPRRYRNVLPQDRLIDKNLEKFNDYANTIGLPIKYTCDALWLFNFCVKWSHVSMDMHMTLPLQERASEIVPFFEDIRFQEWAIANYQSFYKENPIVHVANYKKPLKNLIYKFNKDEDYYKNKGKVNSWSSNCNGLQYTDLCIWDEKGLHHYDLQLETQASQNVLSQYRKQEKNRRWYLREYLKEWVDVERFLAMEER